MNLKAQGSYDPFFLLWVKRRAQLIESQIERTET